MSIIPLASGLADKVGEQDNKLETLACCFAKLGMHKPRQIKIWTFVTQSNWDPKTWNPWKSDKNEKEDVMGIDSEMDKMPDTILLLMQKKAKVQQWQQ